MKPIACQVSKETSPLVAFTNYINLRIAREWKYIPTHRVEERVLIKPIQHTLVDMMPRLFGRLSEVSIRKEHFLQIVASLANGIHLSPRCRRCAMLSILVGGFPAKCVISSLAALHFLFIILIHVIIFYRIDEFEQCDEILLFLAFNI
jgi:hypothetical protein